MNIRHLQTDLDRMVCRFDPKLEPDTEEEQRLRKNLGWVVFGVSLFIYTLTVCPSAPPGDSSEMISSAYTLGVPHPPGMFLCRFAVALICSFVGYPLITLIGKLFSIIIPVRSIAWRINYLSSVCDAAAAAIMFHLLTRMLHSTSAGLIGAMLFAFTPLMWTYALVAEVFSLNNLLVVGLLYLTIMFVCTEDVRYAQWGATVMGLGLCNQHTITMYIIPLFPFIAWYGRRVLFASPWVLPRVFLWGLAGLTRTCIAHRCVPSHRQHMGDHRTLRGVLKHFLREEYGTFQLASNHHAQHQWPSRIYLLTTNFAWRRFIMARRCVCLVLR